MRIYQSKPSYISLLLSHIFFYKKIIEYTFISKETFNGIINHYLSIILTSCQEKALVNLELLERIKKILLNPSNIQTDDKNTRNWTKKRFYLEEITPESHRVMVKNKNKPVLIVKNMYEVLCKTHAKIDNHTDQKQL